jgi:hypothetical protein
MHNSDHHRGGWVINRRRLVLARRMRARGISQLISDQVGRALQNAGLPNDINVYRAKLAELEEQYR